MKIILTEMKFRENSNIGWVSCKPFLTKQFVSETTVWWNKFVWWGIFLSKYQCYLPYLQIINDNIKNDLAFLRCSFISLWNCVCLKQKCDFCKRLYSTTTLQLPWKGRVVCRPNSCFTYKRTHGKTKWFS